MGMTSMNPSPGDCVLIWRCGGRQRGIRCGLIRTNCVRANYGNSPSSTVLQKLAADPENSRFLFLMTPHSVRRSDSDFSYCLNELAYAREKRIPVIPIMVAACQQPMTINAIQFLDMTDCARVAQPDERYQAKLDRLIEDIELLNFNRNGLQSTLKGTLRPFDFGPEMAKHVNRFKRAGMAFCPYLRVAE